MSTNTNEAASEFRLFKAWADEWLGQGYSLDIEGDAFIDPVTRWAFKGFKAGLMAGAAPVEASELPPLPAPLEIMWPQLHSVGLGCGVEDRGLHNRYECAEYGFQEGVDRAASCVPDDIYDSEAVRAIQAEAYDIGKRAALASQVPGEAVADRAAFEKWGKQWGYSFAKFGSTSAYESESANIAWGAWKAALKTIATPTAPVLAAEAASVESIDNNEFNALLEKMCDAFHDRIPPYLAARKQVLDHINAWGAERFRHGWGEGMQEAQERIAAADAANALQSLDEWKECERISDLPDVDDALRGFSEDPTGDNGICVVRAIRAAISAAAPAKVEQSDIDNIINCYERRIAEISVELRAVKAAAPATPSVPEGYVLVPTELTPEMEKAADDVSDIGMEHDGDLGSQGWVNNIPAMYAAMLAAAPQAAQPEAAPSDPMDWPLPCAVKVGHGTIGKGCKLRTLVARMQVLYDMAHEDRQPAMGTAGLSAPDGWKIVPRTPDDAHVSEVVYNINRKYKGNPMSNYLALEVWKYFLHCSPPIIASTDRDAVREAIAAQLVGTYYCGRVWSAWQVGTMGQDDFTPAEEVDEVLDGLTDAAIAAMRPTASGAGDLLVEHAQSMQGARKVIAELRAAADAFMKIYDHGEAPGSTEENDLRCMMSQANSWLFRDVHAVPARTKLLADRPTANGAAGQS